MKSTFGDRNTIGTDLLNTHEEHLKASPIEVGEFVEEFGKQYMKDILDWAAEGAKSYDKFYLNIFTRKSKLYLGRAFEVIPYIEKSLPLMQENQDVWKIDCVSQKIFHMWTLPEESEFDMILANPCKDNEKLIKWINIFKSGLVKVKHAQKKKAKLDSYIKV